jgi:hypothetical protein
VSAAGIEDVETRREPFGSHHRVAGKQLKCAKAAEC